MRSPLLVMSLEVEYNGAIVSLVSFVRAGHAAGGAVEACTEGGWARGTRSGWRVRAVKA